MKKLFTFIALVFLFGNIYAAVRNVPGTYATIQAAINASVNTDTVLVAPGTYMENINFRGKMIVVTSMYYVTNDPATIYSTIINGSTPANPDSASCVIICSHEDSTTVLQGFAITGGSGTRWNDEHGPGNFYREGGGILIQYSAPIIQNNIIYNNLITNNNNVVSTGGGGMRIGDSYPRLYNNIISGNTGKYGAGVVFNFSGCDMKNNIICVNYGSDSYGAGSGIWTNGSGARPRVIENNSIVNNSAAAGTGGIFQSGTTTLRNNIIWGNTPGAQISGSGATVTYSDVQGGFTGAGNINLDPMFADSNFYFMSGSPCIDAGDSNAIYNDPADTNNPGMALYPSMGTVRNDMGAYGGPLRKILSNQIIGIHQISSSVPNAYALKQNYPNPFNPKTVISYQLLVNSYAVLTIFDILGKEVAVLVNQKQQPGSYNVDWDASNYPSGIYFYKLEAGNFSQTKKMILIK
jgi:hypothetical protein